MRAFLSRMGIKPYLPALALTGLVGMMVGLGLFTFHYGKGTSYFSDNPETCVNCHVMRDQFDAWGHSSHARVATCNDCHTPHTNIVDKWFVKGLNGFNHSVAFTTGDFHEPIHIKDFNANVAEASCVYCHQDLVRHLVSAADGEGLACISCHSDVGHRTRK